ALRLPPRLDLLPEVAIGGVDPLPELALQLVLRCVGEGIAQIPEPADEAAALAVVAQPAVRGVLGVRHYVPDRAGCPAPVGACPLDRFGWTEGRERGTPRDAHEQSHENPASCPRHRLPPRKVWLRQ